MSRIVVVGDGPAGLSAALFLAKNGHEAVVYGQDETPMHYARLRNYLGVEDEPGPAFQERARAQAARHGAELVDGEVESIEVDGDRFRVTTDGGTTSADYVVLAAGKKGLGLARGLGVAVDDGAVTVDGNGATSVDRVYAAGRIVRPNRSQAVVSAGAGATVALEVLSREAGEDVHDWDTLDD